MPSLAQIVANIRASNNLHPEFRLILSSAPYEDFPVDVLRNSVKLTCEPPAGLRANLLHSLAERRTEETWKRLSPSALSSSSSSVSSSSMPMYWDRLLYALCFFHAVVLERKKFGPLGWNVEYEFNDSDLDTSITTLRLFLADSHSNQDDEEIPWAALRYLIGDVLYGGRVTDQWDMRCLSSILKRHLTPSIIAPSSLSPRSSESSSEPLDISEGPEVFGMDETADKVHRKQDADNMLQTLAAMQPGVVLRAPMGRTQDDIVSSLASEILSSLPPLPTDTSSYHSSLRADEFSDPLTIFLKQEVSRYSLLLITIRTTLTELIRAIKGLAIMSNEMDNMFQSLLTHSIPSSWIRVAYPTTKSLLPFMRDLHSRIAFVRDWVVSGHPSSFWLSGFFFPQGFLTSVLQRAARQNSLPVDSLSFSTRVLEEYNHDNIREPPEEGVYVYGLHLSGAKWDSEKQTLGDTTEGVIYSQFPVIHLIPTQNCILTIIVYNNINVNTIYIDW